MISWQDSIGRKWRVEYCLSRCGGYVNRTTYPPIGNHASTVQMTIEAFKKLQEENNNLKTEE